MYIRFHISDRQRERGRGKGRERGKEGEKGNGLLLPYCSVFVRRDVNVHVLKQSDALTILRHILHTRTEGTDACTHADDNE